MSPPSLQGIHHLKLAVSDLRTSLTFYEQALGVRRIPEFDHRDERGAVYAHILAVPGLDPYLELRLHPEQAARHRGFDPITLTVADRATLQAWDDHLTAVAIPHSPVLTALQAWLIVLADPDDNRLRLYTLETHGPELPPSRDPWLGT